MFNFCDQNLLVSDLIRVAEMPVVLMPSVHRAEREQFVIVDEDI